jgi:cation:H+ antiporter
LRGRGDLAFGNVIGSNTFNILFILGISAAITPLIVSRQLVVIDVPIMIAAALLVIPIGWDNLVSRAEGIFLSVLLIGYIVVLIRIGRNDPAAAPPIDAQIALKRGGSWPMNIGLVVVGLVLLVIGARWLVDGAVSIAQLFGVSELIIGLTIVAAGTSLPEVATSIIAAMKGERDIAVGNVVGSCIFNLLAVLGLSSIIAPNGIAVAPAALRFDVPVMIAASLAALPIFFTGHLIARWEGFLFLFYYAAYTSFLVLDAAQHHAVPTLSNVMLLFVLPLTAITLLVLVFRSRRKTFAAS